MKKAIIILAIMMLGCGYSIGQQYSFYDESDVQTYTDGFFESPRAGYRAEDSEWGVMPLLPQTHGYHYDYPAHIAPVGSGLLLLAGMGIGYAIRKRKTES